MKSFDGQLTVEALQHVVDEWITTTGGGYFSPLTNMAVLTEETGEVARIMARCYGDQKCKPGEEATSERLADELADIMWVVAAIANQTGIDLTRAIERNLEKKNIRDCNRFK